MKESLGLKFNDSDIDITFCSHVFIRAKRPNLVVLADINISLLYNIKFFRHIEFTLLGD